MREYLEWLGAQGVTIYDMIWKLPVWYGIVWHGIGMGYNCMYE